MFFSVCVPFSDAMSFPFLLNVDMKLVVKEILVGDFALFVKSNLFSCKV